MKSNNSDPTLHRALDPARVAGLELALDATRLDLNKLRTFSVIAEAGGVTAAARRLALTRSAVSHSLASLEAALGVALFHRVGRQLVLSRDGERLARAYRDAEVRIARALEAVSTEAREVRGTLRLGLLPGFSRLRLADALHRFLAEHPAARVRLLHRPKADLARLLNEGRLEFALSLRPTAPGAARIRSNRLFEQTLVLAARRRPKRRGDDLAWLSQLPLVDYFRGEPLIDRWVAHHFGRRRLPAHNVRAWVGSATDLALELTRQGVGACVLPHDLVEPHRRRKELVVVRGRDVPLRDEIWLNELADARATAIATAFRAALLG